jgi:threonine aldolase
MKEKICLASDNFTSAHPFIIEAISKANEDYAPSYGADKWTLEAEQLICDTFSAKPKILFMPSGTGANVLALKLACQRHESVICTDIAHMQYQESGAAESIVGCKLLTVPNKEGKLIPDDILRKLKSERAFGKHSTSPRVLSITLPTEVGTVYSLEELQIFRRLCFNENLLLHIDGSRIYNAAVYLNASLSEIYHAASPDILSLGGTKNGLMFAEALLIFNNSLQAGCEHLHKQTLQLISKMRYLSAQYLPFFQNELWRTLAIQANQKATDIAEIIKTTPGLSLSYPVQTNQIFFTAPSNWFPIIQEKIVCYPWNHEKNEIRFIASWNTSNQDIEEVRYVFNSLSKTT